MSLIKLELNFHPREVYFPCNNKFTLTENTFVYYSIDNNYIYNDKEYLSISYFIYYLYNGG